ncbi:MAG TPA: ferritin family protein [Anaerolineae bacterium]
MDTSGSVETILKRAIVLEEESANMYAVAAQSSKNAPIRQRLEEMAAQEREHMVKLQEILAGNVRWAVRRSKAEPVTDLRLSDHLEAKPLDANADYQDVLLVAARREKASHDFYQAMAEMVDDKLIKSVFEMLASEELRHKYDVEKTYEEVIYQAF